MYVLPPENEKHGAISLGFSRHTGHVLSLTSPNESAIAEASRDSTPPSLRPDVVSEQPVETNGEVVIPKTNMNTTLCMAFTEFTSRFSTESAPCGLL